MVETRERAKPARWRLKTTLWLDVTLLVSVCALPNVSFTGLVLHEWLGLAMVGMVFAHLLIAWSWIATQSRRLFAQSARERVNYFLNLSLFGAVAAAIFSGILISQKAVPALTGAKAAPGLDWRWDTLHQQFSDAVLTLSAFHLALNWDWALAAVQKLGFPWVETVRERFCRFREGSVKVVRVLSRVALLSVVAAAFVGLTALYGGSVRIPLPNPSVQAEKLNRPSAPQVSRFPEFLGEAWVVAIYAVGGRLVFRLRLSRVSRSEGPPILLDLH